MWPVPFTALVMWWRSRELLHTTTFQLFYRDVIEKIPRNTEAIAAFGAGVACISVATGACAVPVIVGACFKVGQDVLTTDAPLSQTLFDGLVGLAMDHSPVSAAGQWTASELGLNSASDRIREQDGPYLGLSVG
jgi:hypothetical protein